MALERIAKILAWGSLPLPCATPALAAAKALPEASDFAIDGALAKERGLPILLFFNRDGCPYCERALREFLEPMASNRDYDARVLFRQVEIDRSMKLVDFDGSATTHRAFASRFDIRLTPTIWMVDGSGKRLGDPLVGLGSRDYYGYYLDRAIDESRDRIRG